MVLTAESGWSFGEGGYGPDKMKELREALNEFLKEEGKDIINWEEEDSVRPEQSRTASSPTEIGDAPSRHSRERGNPAPKDRSGRRAEARSQSRGLGSTASEQRRPNKGPRVRSV
jgi:hypothetical protein